MSEVQVVRVVALGGYFGSSLGQWYECILSDEVWNSVAKMETRALRFFAKDEIEAYQEATKWLNREKKHE